MKSFETKEKFIKQIVEDNIYKEVLIWADRQPNLNTILKKCPLNYRISLIGRGYTQFEEDCDFDEIDQYNLFYILDSRPELVEKCDFDKLDGEKQAILLSIIGLKANVILKNSMERRNFIFDNEQLEKYYKYCEWDKLSGRSGHHCFIATNAAKYCIWDKLSDGDWALLLSSRPEFINKCDLNKLDEHYWRIILNHQPQLEQYIPETGACLIVVP